MIVQGYNINGSITCIQLTFSGDWVLKNVANTTFCRFYKCFQKSLLVNGYQIICSVHKNPLVQYTFIMFKNKSLLICLTNVYEIKPS